MSVQDGDNNTEHAAAECASMHANPSAALSAKWQD
jgi:hypothetical protein